MRRASAKTWPSHRRDPRAHGLVNLVRGCRSTRGTDRIARRSAELQYRTVGSLTEKLRLHALSDVPQFGIESAPQILRRVIPLPLRFKAIWCRLDCS